MLSIRIKLMHALSIHNRNLCVHWAYASGTYADVTSDMLSICVRNWYSSPLPFIKTFKKRNYFPRDPFRWTVRTFDVVGENLKETRRRSGKSAQSWVTQQCNLAYSESPMKLCVIGALRILWACGVVYNGLNRLEKTLRANSPATAPLRLSCCESKTSDNETMTWLTLVKMLFNIVQYSPFRGYLQASLWRSRSSHAIRKSEEDQHLFAVVELCLIGKISVEFVCRFLKETVAWYVSFTILTYLG